MAGDKLLDSWKRFEKSGSHFGRLKLAGRQHEGFHLRRHNCRSFSDTIANTIIFREHDPATAANFHKPIFVFGVGQKVVVVNLDCLAAIA
jgi:hypothetical protein